MSHQALYVGRADDALDMARAAHSSAIKAGLPALAAESLIMQAHAYAINNETSACGKSLNAAEQAFERSNAANLPEWLCYFDEAYMAAKFGHCFRELGQSDKAESFARRSLDMVDGYVRGQTFNVVLLANALLQQQNLDAACTVGNQAVDLGSGLQSARTIRYIRDLRRRMSRFNNEPVVEDFQSRAHELLPASDPRASTRGHAA
jgi:tetratricopeptide (TPR) repeat protein